MADEGILIPQNKYGWFEYFFLASEFSFGIATVEARMLSKAIGSGNPNFAQALVYLEPFGTLIILYAADSFFGKLWVLAAFTGGIGVVQTVVVILAACGSLRNATGDSFSLVMTFLTDVHRPLRWALMYASKPNKPFKQMRRFIVLTEAAYLFGKFAMKTIKWIPGVVTSDYLDIVLPMIMALKYTVYTVTTVLIFRKQELPTYFERFAVDRVMQDIACMIAKKAGWKSQALQSKLQNRQRNKALSVGVLVTLAVFLPFTIARFDNEMIQRFIRVNKDFLTRGILKFGMDAASPFISGMTLIGIEYVFTPLIQRIGRHPYYIFWLTFSYIAILASASLMAYMYVQLEINLPFPKLPPGKAGMSVFNCLPASLEVEWSSMGEVDRVQNLDYTRTMLIEVNQQAAWKVVLHNKPTGKYWSANVTMIEGRENVYVANYDGMTRANISEPMYFDRYLNTKAQMRILDCFEMCCHGTVTVSPKKLVKKYRRKQKSVTVNLTQNLLSKRIDIYEGTYGVSYQPDANTSLQLGTIQLDRTDKVVLILHSFQHPKFKFVNMVALSTHNSYLYFSMCFLHSLFRISHAYQKMIVVYLTDRKIFSFMLGIHFMLTRTAAFLSVTVFYGKHFNQDMAFAMLGLSGLCFVAYLAVIIKFKRRFNPTIELEEDAPKLDRALSNETKDSTDPKKDKAL